jgi:hypothetical protein
MPTHRSHPDNRDPILFKNLLKKAKTIPTPKHSESEVTTLLSHLLRLKVIKNFGDIR